MKKIDRSSKVRTGFHQAKWDEPVIFELSKHGERGILVNKGQCVFGLVVFCHIGRRYQNHRLVQQAEFRNGTGAGAGDYQVGGSVGIRHVLDEICHIKVGKGADVWVVHRLTGCCGDCVPYLFDIYFTGLPDELYVGVLPDDVQTCG